MVRPMIEAVPEKSEVFRAVLRGTTVTIRPARPQDAGTIQAYLRGLSGASQRNRFLGAVSEISESELHRMTHRDRCSYPALIAESVTESDRVIIGEARHAVAPDDVHCEFALSVGDTWRRRALGTLMVAVVAGRARALGLRYLVGDVFRSNEAMIALARRIGFSITGPVIDGRLVRITRDLLCAKPPS